MPRKTDGDKIDELEKLGASLTVQIASAVKELEAVFDAHSETAKTVIGLQREFEKEVALLKREIEEFKRWKEDQKKAREEQSRRLWAFGPNLLAALISGLISAAVAYFVARR